MATDPRLGSELAGYRIEALIARGSMGVVYRAQDPELSRQVALKVIAPGLARDPGYRERFLAEMKVAAALEHPHVCPVYRAGESEGELFLVMRLLEGEDLGQRVAREGPLAPALVAELVSQLASALDYAHARSLCHRDVKPENVLLDAAGNAYLTDFGLAAETFTEGEAGTLAGTLSYLAPERLQGEPALPASDQYALACLATCLLTGGPPFVREHEAALLYAHLREDPPSLAEQGLARLDPVLQKALAKDPSERYPSCSAFASELAAAISRPERVGGEAWPEGLPRPATRLVGRQSELQALESLLRDPETRLATLTGPGGTGKTRLALHAAAESADAFPDGVSWVSLAPLRDPAYALSAIAQALEIQEQPPAPLVETLREALTGKECLLVLDNAEHLLPEIADDVAALREAPGPTFLVTSRERLDLQAERLYPVPSLHEAEAIELFSDRASYLDPDHDPSDPAIASLCERLDSLPLALELAAARTTLFTPEQLLERLSQRLDLLKGGRDADPRQQTLRATIEWSYNLLSEAEQRLFRFLSVFAGGCIYEAAEEVAGADPDTLQSLLDKSLLRRRDSELGPRYWMLETIREFARERLAESGEREQLGRVHAVRHARLAVELSVSSRGRSAETLQILREEQGNMRAALEFALQRDEAAVASDLIHGLWFHWLRTGSGSEAAAWAHRYLASSRERLSPLERFHTDLDVAEILRFAGDAETAIRLKRELVAIGRANPEAVTHGIVMARSIAATLSDLAYMELDAGHLEEARACGEEALVLRRDLGRPGGIAHALLALAAVAYYERDVVRARDLYLEAIDGFEMAGAHGDALEARIALADCELLLGRLDEAAALLREAIPTLHEFPDQVVDVHALRVAGMLAAARGDAERCATLFGAADCKLEESGITLFNRVEDETHRAYLARARTELGEEAFHAGYDRGADASEETVWVLALENLD